MEVGAVSYKDNKKVKVFYNIGKDKETLKRLEKTYDDRKVDFEAEKEAYFKEFYSKKKKENEEIRRKQKEEEESYKKAKNDKGYGFMDIIGNETTNKVMLI